MKEYVRPIVTPIVSSTEGVFAASGSVTEGVTPSDTGGTISYRVVTQRQPDRYNNGQYLVYVTNNTGVDIQGQAFYFDVSFYGSPKGAGGGSVSSFNEDRGTITISVNGQWITNGGTLNSPIYVELYADGEDYDIGLM